MTVVAIVSKWITQKENVLEKPIFIILLDIDIITITNEVVTIW